MKKQAKAFAGGKELKIHNPSGSGVHLTLRPPERTTMANKKNATKKKKGGQKKGKKRNTTQTAKASSAVAKTTKKANRAKKKPTKRFYLKNPLPSLGQVSAMEWAAFVLAALTSRTLTSLVVNPDSVKGIGVQIGLTWLTAKFAPKGVRTAATLGAGGGALISGFNRVTNGAVPKAIVQYIGPLVPWRPASAGQLPANNNGTGSGVVEDTSDYTEAYS